MIHNGVSKFLSDVVEKAENLEDLENIELTVSKRVHKKLSTVQIVRTPLRTYSEFYTENVPEEWGEKIEKFSPRIKIKGSLGKLSP